MFHYSGAVNGGSSPQFTSSHPNTLWQLLPQLDMSMLISCNIIQRLCECYLLHQSQRVMWAQRLSMWLCQFSAAPWMQSGWGVMGGTKSLFVPLSCISDACCGGRPLAADEPCGGGDVKRCLGEKGGAAWLTVACSSWRGGGSVTMVTWLRKVWGLDAVWLPLPVWSCPCNESPPLFNTWALNKLLMWVRRANGKMKEFKEEKGKMGGLLLLQAWRLV